MVSISNNDGEFIANGLTREEALRMHPLDVGATINEEKSNEQLYRWNGEDWMTTQRDIRL